LARNVTTVDIDNSTGYAVVRELSPLPPFVMIFQDLLLESVRDRTLNGEARRVLDYVIATMKFGHNNYSVVISQKELSVYLGVKPQCISRAIVTLQKRGVLLKGSRAGKGTIYLINPHWAWKGEGKDNLAARNRVARPKFSCGNVSSLDEKRKKKSA